MHRSNTRNCGRRNDETLCGCIYGLIGIFATSEDDPSSSLRGV